MARHDHRRDRGANWLVLVMAVHIPSHTFANQNAVSTILCSHALKQTL